MKIFKTCEGMDFDREFISLVRQPETESIGYKYLDPNMDIGTCHIVKVCCGGQKLLTWQAFLISFLLVATPLLVYLNK